MNSRALPDPAANTDATNVPNIVDDGGDRLAVRAAATGEHAEKLKDAGHRVEAVASLLAQAALDAEIHPSLDAMIKLLDQAGRQIGQAGGS